MIGLIIESIQKQKKKLSLIALQFVIGFTCLLLGVGVLENTINFKKAISKFTALGNIHVYVFNEAPVEEGIKYGEPIITEDPTEQELKKLDKYRDIVEKVKKEGVIDKFGLFEKRDGYKDQSIEAKIDNSFYILNKVMFSLLTFDIDKGQIEPLINYNSDKDYIPVLVSKTLENQYPLNSQHDIYFADFTQNVEKCTIKVVGVLSKRSVFFTGGCTRLTENALTNKEYVIIPQYGDFHWNTTYEYNSLVSLTNNVDMVEKLAKLNDIYEKNEIKIYNNPLKEEVKEYYSQRKPVMIAIIIFASIILLLSALGFIGTILSSIISRKKEFGIYFSIGISKKNLIKLVLGEMVLLFVSSFLLANVVNFLMLKGFLADSGIGVSFMATFATLIIITVLILPAIIIPVRYLSKLQPIELIRERSN
ncbi:MAG: ABC transporter permease [Clostridiales bacterium]|nr:ABC transporter permease [Clostridiales bacterium]